MNPTALEPPLLIVISAPSGGGKTTLCSQLLAARPAMRRAITCTTRASRAGEQPGVDYYFLDRATFERRVAAGDFLEHANVYGNWYGTLRSEVLDKLRAGSDVLLNVDVQGAAAVRRAAEGDDELRRSVVSVFLTPPSFAVLEQRLRKRATDAAEVIEGRLRSAREEIARWQEFDYLLISATIPEDLERMLKIVDSERMRTLRARAPGL